MIKKITKIIKRVNSESQNVTSAAVIIGSLTIVSRLLGVIRDRVLAGQFGAGDVLDVYYASFRLPDTIYNLLVLGVVSAGLIPVFSGLLAKNQKSEAFLLANRILNILLFAMIILCGFLFLFTPQIVALITPGFSPEKMQEVISLSRIMFLSPIFLGISAIFSSILQSLKKFLIYSIAPLFYNLGIIFGALFLVPWLGVAGLAWGVVLGSLMHMLIQFLPLKSAGWQWRPESGHNDANVREVLKLMLPRTLSLGVSQLNFFILTIFASMMAGGSLAVYNFAYNLQNFPLGVFGVSLGVAALPILSEYAAKNKKKEFAEIFSSTLRQTLFFIIPVASLTYVFRAQIVRLILGSGQFNWLDTRLTAACLAIFCLALFAEGAYPLVIRSFYAVKDTKTPLLVGFATVIVNLLAVYGFSKFLSSDSHLAYCLISLLRLNDLWGYADFRVLALPLAMGVSAIFELLFLMLLLRIKSGPIGGGMIWSSFWRIVFASLGSSLSAYFVLLFLSWIFPTDKVWGLMSQAVIAGLLALGVYVIFGYIFKLPELFAFIKSFKKKLFKEAKIYAEDNLAEGDRG